VKFTAPISWGVVLDADRPLTKPDTLVQYPRSLPTRSLHLAHRQSATEVTNVMRIAREKIFRPVLAATRVYTDTNTMYLGY